MDTPTTPITSPFPVEALQSVLVKARASALEAAICEIALRLGAVNPNRRLDEMTDHFGRAFFFQNNPEATEADGAPGEKCPSLFEESVS